MLSPLKVTHVHFDLVITTPDDTLNPSPLPHVRGNILIITQPFTLKVSGGFFPNSLLWVSLLMNIDRC